MILQSSAVRYKCMKKIIITIGRQFGSGGLAVAKELGKRLEIPVYDNELITKAAQESGFSAELFVKNDERKSLFSFSALFADNCVSESGLFNIQCETIKKIASQGSAVIVGRCSDYVLREMDGVLDVFLTSPAEVRAERIIERHSVSLDEAMEMIQKKDRCRSEYYNYYTFGNWGVASTYDLCIDSSLLGIKGTSDYIIEFARRRGMLDE